MSGPQADDPDPVPGPELEPEGESPGGLGDAIGEIGEGFERAGDAIREGFEDADETVREIPGEVVGVIGEGLGNAADEVIGGFASAAGEVAAGAGRAVGDLAAGDVAGAAGALGDGFERADDAVEEGFERAGDALREIPANAAGKVGEGAAQAADEVIGGLGSAAGEVAAGVGRAVGEGDPDAGPPSFNDVVIVTDEQGGVVDERGNPDNLMGLVERIHAGQGKPFQADGLTPVRLLGDDFGQGQQLANLYGAPVFARPVGESDLRRFDPVPNERSYEGARVENGRLVDTNGVPISAEELGPIQGQGISKTVFALGTDRAVGVGVKRFGKYAGLMMKQERELLSQLRDLGFQTVGAQTGFDMLGTPAILYDHLYAGSSKDLLDWEKGAPRIRDASLAAKLNETSINNLREHRALMVQKRVDIQDLQFLIGADGRVDISDPQDVSKGRGPHITSLRLIDEMIAIAENNR